MDIKKMAEMVRAKVHEADETGIFDDLAATALKMEQSQTQKVEGSEDKGERRLEET